MTRPAYTLDHAAIREIAAEWGVEGAVKVCRRSQRPGGSWGWAGIRSDLDGFCASTAPSDDPAEQRHRIVLVTELDRFEVCRTLAHELQHAVQATAAVREGGKLGWQRYCEHEQRTLPYDEHPSEIEADDRAERFWREVYRRCIRTRYHSHGGGRRPSDVPVEPFAEAATRAVMRGESWLGIADRIGWTGKDAGQRLRRALGLRAPRQTHVRYETAEKLMLALHLDPVDVGL